MVMSRMIAFLMISASAAAQAQQQPAAPAQATPAPAAKSDKVCRIHMDNNIPRRVCMTKEQWAQVDAQSMDSIDQTYINRHGCGPDKGGVMGAC
jgi:hypothetical protein